MHAIDQEFAKSLEMDVFRLNAIQKKKSNPNHPNQRFDFGNTEVLTPVSQEVLQQ